ncbi:hypothetical protein ACHAXT_009405 [Thalassiosira profunda]
MPKKGKTAKHPPPKAKGKKGGGGGGGGGGKKGGGVHVGGTSREDKREFNLKHHCHGDKQFPASWRHHHKTPPVKHSKYDDIANELVEEEKHHKEELKHGGHHPHHQHMPQTGAVH